MSRRFVLSYLARVADLDSGMDILARAQFWEGYRGMLPFKGIAGRNSESALLAFIAESVLETMGGEKPEWSGRANTFLYRTCLKKAIVAAHGDEDLAREVLQSDMSRDGVDAGGSIFWAAGKLTSKSGMKAKVADGTYTVEDARKLSVTLVPRHVKNALARNRSRARTLHNDQGDISDQSMGGGGMETGAWTAVIAAVLADPNAPEARGVVSWLIRETNNLSPRYAATMSLFLDDAISGKIPSGGEKAWCAALGIPQSELSNAKTAFLKHIREVLEDEDNLPEELLRLERSTFVQNAMRDARKGWERELDPDRMASRIAASFVRVATAIPADVKAAGNPSPLENAAALAWTGLATAVQDDMVEHILGNSLGPAMRSFNLARRKGFSSMIECARTEGVPESKIRDFLNEVVDVVKYTPGRKAALNPGTVKAWDSLTPVIKASLLQANFGGGAYFAAKRTDGSYSAVLSAVEKNGASKREIRQFNEDILKRAGTLPTPEKGAPIPGAATLARELASNFSLFLGIPDENSSELLADSMRTLAIKMSSGPYDYEDLARELDYSFMRTVKPIL